MDLRETDSPQLRAIFEDIERALGVTPGEECILGPRQIHDVEIRMPLTWWKCLWEDRPRCHICGRSIKWLSVRFQGPFVECLTGKLAACFDRLGCDRHMRRMRQRNILEQEGVARDALGMLVGDQESRLNRVIG